MAIAALFLCFVVATMIVTLARTWSDDVPDSAERQGSDHVVPGFLSGACANPVSIQPPRTDFASFVNQHADGTCFVLAAGTYLFHDVVPKDDMTFVGASTDSVVVDGDGHENAFHGTADGVTIAQMTFRDFNDSAGTTRQEQAPIRGTSALWASNRGQMATNWLVTDIVSSGNYASGLFLGEHWTVRNSIFHSNGVTGIGGDHLVGGVIEANIIYNNGGQQAQGALVNGGGLKITQAGTPSDPVIVRNNEFYDNERIAIWCDIGCDGFHVLDNYIHDHISRGVMYELSSNIVVRGNTILRSNTWTNFQGDFNAGAVTIGESRDALVENNLIDDARSGVTIRQTNRPTAGENFLYSYPYVNFVSSNVTVRNNIIRNTDKMGISTGASGIGQITQPQTIDFVGNSYDNGAGMAFWWNNGEQVTFSQWQSAGRDTSPNGSQSSSPATQTRGPQAGSWTSTTTTTTTTTTTSTTTSTTSPAPQAPPTSTGDTPVTTATTTTSPSPSSAGPEPTTTTTIGSGMTTAPTTTTVFKVLPPSTPVDPVLHPWGEPDLSTLATRIAAEVNEPFVKQPFVLDESSPSPNPTRSAPAPTDPEGTKTAVGTKSTTDVTTPEPPATPSSGTEHPSGQPGQLAFDRVEEDGAGSGSGGTIGLVVGAGLLAGLALVQQLRRRVKV